jgi:rubrerythrin
MTDLRDAARQALEALETVFMPHHPAVIALRAALAEDALQRLTDANQEIEAVLEQEPVEIKPPNPEGATQCIVRWMAETPAGWVGAWDREALEQFTHPPRREALEQTEQEVKGCDHCNHPLYAAIKCRVCGRVTEQEQEPVACPHRDEPRGCYRVRCQLGRKCVEPLFTHPPRREQPKFTLSCGCPSQYGGVPAYWERDGGAAFGMICEKHWHEYGARSEA